MSHKYIDEELRKVQSLLKQEKEEELAQYKARMSNSSYNELRKQGLCWYPVRIGKTSFDSGERLIVRISRPKEHTDAHQFQSGKPVTFFANIQGLSHDDFVSGVVNQVKEQEMLITLNSDNMPEWIYSGYLGVQLLFDEVPYREMERTMAFLIQTEDERIDHLKNILLGEVPAQFTTDNAPAKIEHLNGSQNQAMKLVKQAQELAIIHGPPGTGKTTTLIEAILQTLKFEEQVLVCAPSNAAVDLLVEKLDERQLEVVRIGNPARVNEEQLSRTLDARIAHHQYYKDLKAIRKKADEYRAMAGKYKRTFGPSEREQRRLLYDEANKLRDEAEQLAFFISNDIISKAQVIATTLVGAANYALKGKKFRSVFIDEAAQALEPASWIPILKAERVIFAGDHCQLPPTIKSFEAGKAGLSVTLFEKAIKRNKADIMLTEQYRMNEKIMHFPSRIFYENQLIAASGVATATIFPEDLPVEFIDTAGTGYFEQTNGETFSIFNEEEARLLISHFTDYIHQLEAMNLLSAVKNIGIISPYKAQVTLLQEILKESEVWELVGARLSINTVDAFQGQERDVIYISMVRSGENGEIGFLSDIRRMNVAMTRARRKLVIFGDSATICSNPFYDKFVDYVNEIGAYRSAFEFI